MMVRRIHLVAPATLRIATARLGRLDLVGAVAPRRRRYDPDRGRPPAATPHVLACSRRKAANSPLIMGSRQARPYVAALRAMEAPVRWWVRAGVPTFVAGHELVERYQAPGARLYDLYPALSPHFPIAPAPRPGPRASSAPALVTVARLSPEKGIDDLIRAIALLRDRGVTVTLEVAGEGPHRSELEALIQTLGLTDRVRLAGFVPHGPELVAMLDGADVFVLPSRSEGLPHSLVEAMARALPVIATAVGGVPAFLSHGNGIVVPICDPRSLATAVQGLIQDPPRWAELSRSSLETARQMHPDAQLTEFCARIAAAYPSLVHK